MTPPPERLRTTYSSTLPNSIYHSYTTRTRIDNSRERWSALYEKAKQEDAAEAACYEQLRQDKAERRNTALAADEQRWRDKVEDVLRNGALSYRIRKAKVPIEK